MKPNDTKERFIELRGAGYSLRKCAEQLGISVSTASVWERMLEADIRDATRQEKQALLETYRATQQARIQRIGAVLNKLEAAIEQADFNAVPAPRLLAMYLKYIEAISTFGGNEKPVSDLERLLANTSFGGFSDDSEMEDSEDSEMEDSEDSEMEDFDE